LHTHNGMQYETKKKNIKNTILYQDSNAYWKKWIQQWKGIDFCARLLFTRSMYCVMGSKFGVARGKTYFLIFKKILKSSTPFSGSSTNRSKCGMIFGCSITMLHVSRLFNTRIQIHAGCVCRLDRHIYLYRYNLQRAALMKTCAIGHVLLRWDIRHKSRGTHWKRRKLLKYTYKIERTI